MSLPCSYQNPCSCDTQILRLCLLLPIIISVSPLPPLMPFHFLNVQVLVLNLLVNLGDCNIRIKDLTEKLVSLSFWVSHLNLFFHDSSPATASHSHMLNLIISSAWTTQIAYSVHLPSLQLSYSTFTANILQTYLDIQPTTLVFSSLTSSIIIITQLLPCKYPQLPSLPLSVSYFLANPQYWENLSIHHTISIQYLNIQDHIQTGEHLGMGWGSGKEEITQPGWLCGILNSWTQTLN